jgi:hypothetical protein
MAGPLGRYQLEDGDQLDFFLDQVGHFPVIRIQQTKTYMEV